MKDILFFLLKAFLLIVFLLIVGHISIFIHEMGHAAVYMIAAKDRNWRIIVGSGQTLIRTKHFVFNIRPYGGLFLPDDPNRIETDGKKAMVLFGGILATFLLAILFILPLKAAAVLPGGTIFQICLIIGFLYNFILFILVFISHRHRIGVNKGAESDGMKLNPIMKRLRGFAPEKQ
ncbi:MAG: hypothetical protein J5493_05890 [Lachnospiraceae bacterium]|nr:hypothetical protein [Lachnospiraceae bacterium]